MTTMTPSEFTSKHPGVQFVANTDYGYSTYRGRLWYLLEPNPLPWWKRLMGKVMYVSSDGELVREGHSTAESGIAGD